MSIVMFNESEIDKTSYYFKINIVMHEMVDNFLL